MTGVKEETITKYFRIIKNALHEEVEMPLDSFQIGGVGMTVQADESHVFKRKGALQFRQVTIPLRLVSLLYLLFGSRPFSIFCLPGIPLVLEPSIMFLIHAENVH